MVDKKIEPIELFDAVILQELLVLNNAHAKELSWLNAQKLASMISTAFLARRIGNIDAFILAFDQDADYQGENFLWFKSRYERFVYVDRIAVAASARGQGLARRLYEVLFAAAIHAGQHLITCEVNAEPPNPESDAFHASFGFERVGAASLSSAEKTVRYLTYEHQPPPVRFHQKRRKALRFSALADNSQSVYKKICERASINECPNRKFLTRYDK